MTAWLPGLLRPIRLVRTLLSSPASTSPGEVCRTAPAGSKDDPSSRDLSRERSGPRWPGTASCAGDEPPAPTLCGHRVRSVPGFMCVKPPHSDDEHWCQHQDDYLDQRMQDKTSWA